MCKEHLTITEKLQHNLRSHKLVKRFGEIRLILSGTVASIWWFKLCATFSPALYFSQLLITLPYGRPMRSSTGQLRNESDTNQMRRVCTTTSSHARRLTDCPELRTHGEVTLQWQTLQQRQATHAWLNRIDSRHCCCCCWWWYLWCRTHQAVICQYVM